ncbi:UPF0149 family protein [Caballeronia sp. BR00000012568055]|uniref:YecA/YgfB family protein n=1 Tax=Caballeronia sp. BR00000012568055 TaxID=2918761 RepID=UPI0023F67E66|nr:UPF0149 family protein [Caballeronia sp. BR00000012568055]
MNQPQLNDRLSEAELDRLNGFLESLEDGIANVEMLDGFFTALISGPELVPMSEVLPEVWGENFVFESEAQATEIAELVMRHWNSVARALLISMQDPDNCEPVLFEDEDGFVPGNLWACGFMWGVEMRREQWEPLMDDEETAWALTPMLMLTHEHDPDLELRPPAIKDYRRGELIDDMITAALAIYRYFEPQRREVVAPIRREGVKVGRNDPCPCGSGRKFKQCCGSGTPKQLH